MTLKMRVFKLTDEQIDMLIESVMLAFLQLSDQSLIRFQLLIMPFPEILFPGTSKF